jgi:anti-sigma factor RsiW
MSALTCTQVRELAPELALGVLGGPERAEAIMHTNDCARCQAYVLELTEAADALPLLAGELEPPSGFEHRVMSAIDAGQRRTRRRWLALVAAVAAAAVIASITLVRIIESDGGSAAAPVAVAMHGGRDRSLAAGWAYVTNGHSVAIAVDYGVDSGSYRVRVKPAGGRQATVGRMAISGEYGSWTGRSAQTLGPGSAIALVDSRGVVVCRGTVPGAG